MSRYNTNNPVPSNEVKDFSDNAQITDELIHLKSKTTKDRFGNDLKTWYGIQNDASEAISQYGYITKDSFEDGNTLSLANECLRWKNNGEYYRWDGALPKVVPPGSTPDSTGGVGDGKWVGVGDASLRSDLAKPDGVTLVGGAAKQSDLDATNTLLESRNYPKYKKAAEYARLLTAGGSVIIDCNGDSTTRGYMPITGGEDPFNPPAVLKTTLTNLYGMTTNIVNNLGVLGATLDEMIKGGNENYSQPFSTTIQSSAANIIYCNHCINDSQESNDIHEYRQNLIEFVRLCRLHDKVPILVTPNINPATGNDASSVTITESKSKRLLKYVNVMRQAAHDLDVDLVDNYYYFEKTSRMVSPITLVPDGAHPSTEGYKMAGRNLAIPLVSAHTLYEAWDKAGLGGTTYFDDITNKRAYQITGTPFHRFDGNLSGERTTNNTGASVAVILDNPTDDTVLAFYGLQWGSGTISILYENGSSLETSFGGYVNQFNLVSSTDWDACYIPERCKLYAGLHVPGLLTNTGIAGVSGEGFSISGFGLVPRTEKLSGLTSADEIRNFNPVCTNSEITFMLAMFSIGTQFTLNGCSNNAAAINLEWNGNGTPLTVTTSLGIVYQLPGVMNAGCYLSKMKFNSDKSLEVTVGEHFLAIPAGSSPWPNMYVHTAGQEYTIKYLG